MHLTHFLTLFQKKQIFKNNEQTSNVYLTHNTKPLFLEMWNLSFKKMKMCFFEQFETIYEQPWTQQEPWVNSWNKRQKGLGEEPETNIRLQKLSLFRELTLGLDLKMPSKIWMKKLAFKAAYNSIWRSYKRYW